MDKVTGEITVLESFRSKTGNQYQDVFGHTIIELAEKNDKIAGATPCNAKRLFPLIYDGCHARSCISDVGICEQHVVTLSAARVRLVL
jgi:1-deoxy-D-xylulose-5-phosphate synthase